MKRINSAFGLSRESSYKKSGIYKISNIANGKFYIGSSNNIFYRLREHLSAFKRNKHCNPYFTKAFYKYGEEGFIAEILELCPREKLLEREQHYLDTLLFAQEFVGGDNKFNKIGYNINPKAYGFLNIPIPVIQLDLITGEFIKLHPSIRSASESLCGDVFCEEGVRCASIGKQKVAYGFRWLRYKGGDIKMKVDKYISENIEDDVSVEEIDAFTGEVKYLYKTIGEANKLTDSDGPIRARLRGETQDTPYKGSYWRYYKKLSSRTPEYYLGIDIGKQGCLVLLRKDKQRIFRFGIPLLSNSEYDLNRLTNFLKSWKGYVKHVSLEHLHAIYGASAKSTFSFGYINGAVEGSLAAHEFSYTKIRAKKWQKEMFEGIDRVKDTKLNSIAAAKKLFPDFKLVLTERSKKANHNVSDALLLAEYARRKNL